ncbi:MAG: ABC transporter substrate-binding protein [Gammaproteobacteria bacterium]|nr:ABC transporter substrate-binding protein [Gammaproteobacteria bacterium]
MFLKYPFALLLCLMLGFELALAGTSTAEEIVKTTSDQVIARLKSDREELNVHPELIYDLVDELIIPHFDFTSMSKWVLGQNWRNASDEQKEQFTYQFRTLLVRTYAKALLEYSDNEIKYFPVLSNPDSNLVVVKTEVAQSASTAIPINYSLHVSGGEWKVVDIAIDGISLVSTYRGSFASEIRKNGIDALITKLIDKNNKLAVNETQ